VRDLYHRCYVIFLNLPKKQTNILIELEIRSSTDQDINSLSDDNNERIPSIIHEQSVRLQHQSESSAEVTDYDSSIEDPNERFSSFHKKN
jgi:hypothetical protein